MRVVRAKSAGFCMGVARALEKLDAALNAKKGGRILTFGPIIHNPQVLADYEQKGVVCTENISDARRGDRVIIRAHGIPVPVEAMLKGAGVKLIDATCPRVKKAQMGIAGQSSLGRRLLLLGETEHPEVRGLVSHALPDAFVFASLKELKELSPDPDGDWFFATQTTQAVEEFNKVVAWINGHMKKNIPVLSTICGATRRRQQDVVNLARQVETVVVVGGLTSGNTRRLAQIVEERGIPAIHIETAEQLPGERLKSLKTVGLTAGASTPKNRIDEVQRVLESF